MCDSFRSFYYFLFLFGQDLKSPLVTKDVLLLAHQRRWKNVRSKWMNQTKAHQQKYVTSFELLEALYKG